MIYVICEYKIKIKMPKLSSGYDLVKKIIVKTVIPIIFFLSCVLLCSERREYHRVQVRIETKAVTGGGARGHLPPLMDSGGGNAPPEILRQKIL